MKWEQPKPKLLSRRTANSCSSNAMTIILNGLPQKKKKFYSKFYPSLQKHFTFEVQETKYAGHAEILAFEAAEKNSPLILVAGGDGTLHQVLNGVMGSKQTGTAIGLIPLGSANDFAKTCSLNAGPDHLIRLLKAMDPRPTDIGKIDCLKTSGERVQRYFMNECSVGMGPEVVRRLAGNKGLLGPGFLYISSILATFLTHQPQEVECKTSSWEWKGVARVVALANGKSFGNSTYIAPDASVDDGVLNSFIAGNVPLWKFLLYLQTIKARKKIKDAAIHYQVTPTAELTAVESCMLEADGEMAGLLPARIEIMPGRIKFLR